MFSKEFFLRIDKVLLSHKEKIMSLLSATLGCPKIALHLQCEKTICFQTTYLCTLISENSGHPKLAQVPVWGAPWWLWCHNGASANSGFRDESPVPARGAQFQQGHVEITFVVPVPVRGAPLWHGATTGLSASQFQHGEKMRSQFQHRAGSFLGPNIHNKYHLCVLN